MAEITFASLTIPTPQPYDNKDTQRQLENVCYVVLQMCQQAKTAGVVIDDQRLAAIATAINGLSLSVPPADLQGVEQAIKDLQYNGVTAKFGNLLLYFSGKATSLTK